MNFLIKKRVEAGSWREALEKEKTAKISSIEAEEDEVVVVGFNTEAKRSKRK